MKRIILILTLIISMISFNEEKEKFVITESTNAEEIGNHIPENLYGYVAMSIISGYVMEGVMRPSAEDFINLIESVKPYVNTYDFSVVKEKSKNNNRTITYNVTGKRIRGVLENGTPNNIDDVIKLLNENFDKEGIEFNREEKIKIEKNKETGEWEIDELVLLASRLSY